LELQGHDQSNPGRDSTLTTKQYTFRTIWRFEFVAGDNNVRGSLLGLSLSILELDIQETDQILDNDFDENILASDCSMHLSDRCFRGGE